MPSALRWQRLLALPIAAIMAISLAVLVAPDAAATTRNEKIRHAKRVALHQMGDPYRYGAAGPDAFDCSGLLKYSFSRAGLYLPRTSDAQAAYTRRIARRDMRRGDLMFFHNRGDVYHAAVFIGWRDGRRRFVHASRPGVPVRIDVPWTGSWSPTTLRRR
jgi:cell wall-associated NlpC family hydrolase